MRNENFIFMRDVIMKIKGNDQMRNEFTSLSLKKIRYSFYLFRY